MGTLPHDTAPSAPVLPSEEVRFAVVLYGGVSLAIYINGVAQELLHLVRSTALRRDPTGTVLALRFDDDALTPLERVYREVARRVGSGQPFRERVNAQDPVTARFVVDVLSGTSAGGINGIFLAKALANDRMLDDLRNLWIREGEMSKLLNDQRSLRDLGGRLTPEPRPASLLNSRRMYLKLLTAFDQVDGLGGGGPEAADSDGRAEREPLVDELDLFVTTTDLVGLTLPLRLEDKVVFEDRFRNVFHFMSATEYGTGGARNDFGWSNNPFLAFAARCTSSFPFAFEPMQLADLERVSGGLGPHATLADGMKAWQAFFRDYLRAPNGTRLAPETCGFEKRSFGDGGYLDNKPFSYAIDALASRRDDVRSRRLLLYVEPSPEHPELTGKRMERPDALMNLMLAASDLPRQEAIRGDLQRVLERNRLVARIRRVTRSVEADVQMAYRAGASASGGVDAGPGPGAPGRTRPVIARSTWRTLRLPQLLAVYGPAYGGYSRLRVAELTSELAELVARVSGFDEESDELLGLRLVVSAWRQARYSPDAPPRLPENEFLSAFDLSYRIRRLEFVQDRIDLLFDFDARADDILARAGVPALGPLNEEQKQFLRRRLLELKRQLSDAFIVLRRCGRELRARGESSPLHGRIMAVGVTPQELRGLLGPATTAAQVAAARTLLGLPADEPGAAQVFLGPERPGRAQAFDEAAECLARELGRAFDAAVAKCASIIEVAAAPGALDIDRRLWSIRRALWHYYSHFDDYDMVIFPIVNGTAIGELDEVGVVRVSPEDATTLLRERDETSGGPLLKKLAGTRLANFGAFLDEDWRRSDILWGRLDGAERIVRALLPAQQGSKEWQLVETIILRAQAAIVAEDLGTLDDEQARRILVEALVHRDDLDLDLLRSMLDRLLPWMEDAKMRRVLDETLVKATCMRVFNEQRTLPPERQLALLGRATAIVGGLLDGLSEKYWFIGKRFAGIVTGAGRVVWGFVQLAVPGGLGDRTFGYWVRVLYGFAVVMFVLGWLTSTQVLAKAALQLAGVTFGAQVVQMSLRHSFRVRRWTLPAWLVVAGAVLACAIAGFGIAGLWRFAQEWLGPVIRQAWDMGGHLFDR